MINAILNNLSIADCQFIIIYFSVYHRSRTMYHKTKDCEFRAVLTLTSGEAGLPLWTQSAYLAKQGLYSKSGSKSGVSNRGVSVSSTSVENIIMSKVHSVSACVIFYDSNRVTFYSRILGLRLSGIS